MRLIRLALALAAVSVGFGGVAMANPVVNNSVSGSVGGTVGTAAATQMVASQVVASQVIVGQTQARLDGASLSGSLTGNMGNDARTNSRSSSSNGMDESIPRGWLMALVTVLLIGHQLRRKHSFLRPQRFSDL